MAEKVDEIIILADGSKFSSEGLSSFAQIDKISKLITDDSAPRSLLSEIEKMDVEVIVV